MKKIFAVLLLLIGLSTPVSAASDSFRATVLSYYQKRCDRVDISGERAMLCYLFDKVGKLDTQLSSLADKITVLEGSRGQSKTLKTFDNNKQELGVFVSESWFYSPSLQRLVGVANETGIINKSSTYFTTDDCTGIPYLRINPPELAVGGTLEQFINKLISAGIGRNYIIQRDELVTSINHYSRTQWDYSTNTMNCLSDVGSRTVVKLTPTTVSHPDPVAMPLEFRYE